MTPQKLPQLIEEHLQPFSAAVDTFDALIERAKDADIVLIGEATHGTDEFYRIRSLLTKRLITEHGFNAVVTEADFPDAYRVNQFVRHNTADVNANEALSGFRRFPTWMWRNVVVEEFVNWLWVYNDTRRNPSQQVGYYGMDLYSMYTSIEAVIDYLDEVDPAAAERARYRYGCFDHYDRDPQRYGYAASLDVSQQCQDEAVEQLLDLQQQVRAHISGSDLIDAQFYAEQNARLVENAEAYYRSMFWGSENSWNLRDQHMVETLNELRTFLERTAGRAKLIVWAHNSHLGDARATEVTRQGQINVGQLVREQHGSDARLIGFSTYTGSVTAAHNWGEAAHNMPVNHGLPGSYEDLFHKVGVGRFVLSLRDEDHDAIEALREPRLARAIGVIYRPQSERASHYYHVNIPAQFDDLLYLDETHALEPLERYANWTPGEGVPETYPYGI